VEVAYVCSACVGGCTVLTCTTVLETKAGRFNPLQSSYNYCRQSFGNYG